MITITEQADGIAHPLNGSLDVNGQFPFRVETKKGGNSHSIACHIDLSYASNPQFVQNIADLASLQCAGKRYYFHRDGAALTCNATLTSADLAQGVDLCINDIPVSRYMLHKQNLLPVTSQRDYQLTASETRMLSFPMTEDQLKFLPYPRTYAGHLHEYRLPITDLHTHLSSQLSSDSLVALGIGHDLAYPIELLDEAGIDYAGLTQHPVTPFVFHPAINNKIARECEKPASLADPSKLQGVKLGDLKTQKPESFRKLLQLMSIPADGIYGPDDFDTLFYRYRNPLEKNPVLAHDKILQVAADYKHQGVQYAELSTGTMIDDPKWLREAVPAIEEAEKKYGVKLRLLAGIPRTSSPDKVTKLIERIKFVAQCPYVVGVDFLGYEANKTGDFRWALYNLARWARRLRNGVQETDEYSSYKDDFVLRVHAGENNENINNVNEAVEIARTFGVSMRIGHALFANYSKTLLDAVKSAGVVMESILPSNIALNNILYPHDSKLRTWAEAGINFVEGTDGAGAYQITIDQLTRDALHAGLTPRDLERRHQFEEDYIRQRLRVFDDKKAAFHQNYKSFDAFMEAYETHCKTIDNTALPDRFIKKTPVLIAGASGASWEDIVQQDATKQKNYPARMTTQIRVAMRMLVEILDPNKVYFSTGRVKDRGVEKELDKAIELHDNAHWRKAPPFDMIATTSRGDGAVSIANGVTWVNAQLHGKLQNVVRQVVDFLTGHAYTESGKTIEGWGPAKGCYAMFIGGKSMTSEFIRYAREQDLPHGLVKGPVGIADKETSRACADGKQTITASEHQALAEAMVKAVMENLGTGVLNEHYQAQVHDDKSADAAIRACYEEKLAEVLRENRASAKVPSHTARVR